MPGSTDNRFLDALSVDEIMLRISSSLESENTLQAIVDAAAYLAKTPVASLYLLGRDGEYLGMAAHGVSPEQLRAMSPPQGSGMIMHATETRDPVEIDDYLESMAASDATRAYMQSVGIRAVLAVPLLTGDEVVGALYVAKTEPGRFPPDTVASLRRLAAFAQQAIQNSLRFSALEADRTRLLLERERSRSHLLAELLELSGTLNSDLSVPVLLEHVIEAAMNLVGGRGGTAGLLEGDRIVFHRYWINGWTDFDVSLRQDQGIPGHVWRTMEAHVTNNVAADPYVLDDLRRRFDVTRLISVPMVDRDGVLIGILQVHDSKDDRDFEPIDVEALRLLAHQAAIAIQNARLNDQKDEFLSVVSHELKTPVTALKGFTQVMERRLSPESREMCSRYLNIMNRQTDRLTELINDLLDLSRIQRGQFAFDTEPLDYVRLVHDVVMEMELAFPAHRILVEAPGTAEAMGNGGRLRQVLVNLIDNAAKYGPPDGAIHLTVEIDGPEVLTYVCDEGPGLPPHEVDAIFKPYYQINDPARKAVKGIGLGLFVSRQIVEEHGGRLWLDTSNHTSFCFSLPAADGGETSWSR